MNKLLQVSIPLMLAAGLSVTMHANNENDNYAPHNPNVAFTQTNLPIMIVNTNVDGTGTQKIDPARNAILAKMTIVSNPDGLNYPDLSAHPGQTIDYEGYIALKYRGNSSFNASDKKPYGIRTLKGADLKGKKEKVEILGMGKDNRWATIAPWADRSMMRDILTFEMARPWFHYVPSGRFVEMVVDNVYYGVVLLMERVSDGKYRLNLSDWEGITSEADLPGDIQLELDRPGDDPYFQSPYAPWMNASGQEKQGFKITYQYAFPEQEDFGECPVGADKVQSSINAALDKMEASFRSENKYDPETGYRSQIEVNSFIDYMLATELSSNIDGYRLSTNLYKYSAKTAEENGYDPRWQMSLWDFNIAYGNANYNNGESTNKWMYRANEWHNDEQVPFYWYVMMNDPSFVQDVKTRWTEHRAGNYSDERICEKIDSIATLLTSGGAVARNDAAWNIITREGVWPCPYTPTSYEDEINHLKTWILKRAKFMDYNLKTATISDIIRNEQAIAWPMLVKSGWNADMVAENDKSDGSEGYADTGLDGNYFLYTDAFEGNGGLPDSGDLLSPAGVQYKLEYGMNSALHMNSNGQTASVEFSTPAKCDRLYFTATSGNGESTVGVTLNYSDGTSSEEKEVVIPDWSRRNPDGTEAISGIGRGSGSDVSADPHYALYEFGFDADKTKQLKGVTLTHKSDARSNIFAFASNGDASTSGISRVGEEAPLAVKAVYNVEGARLSSLQPGVNIVVYSDGSTKKIIR